MFRGEVGRGLGDSGDPISCLNRHIFRYSDGNENVPSWHRYFSPIVELSEGLPVPIFGVMILIWQLRSEDLQKLYPLDSLENRMGFLGWCLVHGKNEYRSLQECDALWESLQRPAKIEHIDFDRSDAGNVFTWEMLFLSRTRTDLTFDIHTVEGRNSFFVWYIAHGAAELHGEEWCLSPWQIDYLNKESGFHSLSNFQTIVYQARPDVISAFPLPTERGNYIAWCSSAPEFRQRNVSPGNPPRSEVQEKLSFGVNVVGYAFGQLGIGEDARMAATALHRADVPVVILNFAPGANVGQNDRSMQKFVVSKAQYNFNLYCLTALEQGRYFAEFGTEVARGGYNIGYWPWELSEWPEEWQHLFSLVDEVWVSSQHTYDAIAPVSTVPLKLMPMAVEIPEPNYQLTRADFGLPDQACLYLFAFDLNSSIYRKNPAACIEAFLEAFPNDGHHGDVGLVIKVQRPNFDSLEYSALRALQKEDSRIYLVEETLSKADLLALYQNCDAFVSLHRAEGFGRNIAEAMMLRRPVVVTSYSGNLTFNLPENSFLVKYSHVYVGEKEYMHSAGMVWADPSVIHASFQMKSILYNKNNARKKAEEGCKYIKSQHNALAVGNRYVKRLMEVHHKNGDLEVRLS